MLSDVRAKIKEELDTLTGANKPFVNVFDYHTMVNTWYPYVSFEPTNFTAEILNNCSNMRTYNFDILLYQEITNEGRSDALSIVIQWIEDIIGLFDSNYTLDWLALWGVEPLSMDMMTAIWQHWNIFVGKITVACKVIQSIT